MPPADLTAQLCEGMALVATPPSTVGTLAKYFKVPADMLHLLPDSVSHEDGAMIRALCCGSPGGSRLGKCHLRQPKKSLRRGETRIEGSFLAVQRIPLLLYPVEARGRGGSHTPGDWF